MLLNFNRPCKTAAKQLKLIHFSAETLYNEYMRSFGGNPSEQDVGTNSLEEIIHRLDSNKTVEQLASKITKENASYRDNNLMHATIIKIATEHLSKSNVDPGNDSSSVEKYSQEKKDELGTSFWSVTLQRALSVDTKGESIILKQAKERGISPLTLYTLYVGEVALQNKDNPEVLALLEQQVAEIFSLAEYYRYQDYDSDTLPTKHIPRLRNKYPVPELEAAYEEQQKEKFESYREDAKVFISTAKTFARENQREGARNIELAQMIS